MSAICLRGVSKRYGATPVLADLDLDIADGSLTAVLGASGNGKTTLLRLVAGFDAVDAGVITIGGRVVDDGTRVVRPQQRGVGYVPQEGALFPHLTVAGNVAFGLSRPQRPAVRELLSLVGLDGLERRYPHQLSGGQQRRAALARALAIRPDVVLLDEPFGSLDATLRNSLRRDVARILAERGATTVLVTHDQDEALTLADRIAVLRDGHIVAAAAPRALYTRPADLVAATSLGDANLLHAAIRGDRASCVLGDLLVERDRIEGADARRRLVLVRPEQLVLHLEARPGLAAGTVTEVDYHGHDALASLRLDGGGEPVALKARVPGDLPLDLKQRVWVEVRGPVRTVASTSSSDLAE